ncbi:MAG: hypothetical protein ACK5M7_00125 [Draconibacterium sp.]
MGAIIIKIDDKNNRLITKLVKELGGKTIPINEEQYEDLAFGTLMDKEKTGEMVSRKEVMRKLNNED